MFALNMLDSSKFSCCPPVLFCAEQVEGVILSHFCTLDLKLKTSFMLKSYEWGGGDGWLIKFSDSLGHGLVNKFLDTILMGFSSAHLAS